MRTFLFFCSVLFFALVLHAQEVTRLDTARLFYRHFTVQDGLPSNDVYMAYEDRKGYIWFCTDNGISRFDGSQFKNYGAASGLRSNTILGCKEDEKGTLWLYSAAGELYRYQSVGDRFESPSFNASLVNLLAGRSLQDLVFEGDTTYAVTVGAYIKLVNTSGSVASLNLVEAEPMTLAVRILANGERVVINSTEENVTRFNFELSGAKIAPASIQHIPIYGLVQEQLSSLVSGDNLYIVFGENCLTYNLRTRQQTTEILPFSHIPRLRKSSLGILSGSYGKGLWCLNREDDHFSYKQLIRNKNISGCLEDKQGGIWACSQTDGIYFIPDRTALSFPKAEDEASRRVTAMFTSGDSAFYMTYSGALFLVSLQNGELPVQRRLIEPGQYNMRQMKPLNKNEILLFAAGRTMNYSIPSEKVSSISHAEICDRGTEPQLTIFARKDKLINRTCGDLWPIETVISQNWNFGTVFLSARSPSGNLWLAAANDLVYFDPNTGSSSEIGKDHGLRRLFAKYMLPVGQDSIMVASDQGIFLVVKNEIKKSISVENGLSSNKVHTLFLFEGELWAGTSSGVDRIRNYKAAAPATVISVTGLAGISKCPVAHLGCIGNYLVAGTDEGVYFLDRRRLLNKPVYITPLVSDVVANGTSRAGELGEPISFGYDDNSLDIRFHALNYRNSLLTTFRYRLSNNNEGDWSVTTQNHVLLPQLSPGTYRFELEAMNPDGSWSKGSSDLIFTVRKPFWQTWWFITLLVIGGGAAAYFGLLFRIRQMQKVGDLTSKLSEAKMQALGLQLHPHFVFNALNSLSQYLTRRDEKLTTQVLTKLARLMRLVFRNSQQAMIPLEDELKALNLYVELETIRLGKAFNYSINVDTINVAECKIPALLLQPFVENSIWHGIAPLNKEGKLDLVFMRIGDTLQVEITDNGIGRRNAAQLKPKDNRRRHSIDIIKERLVLLRTKYNCYTHIEMSDAYETEESCGTKILLILPWLSDSESRGRDRILKQFMLDDQSAYN